MAQKEDSDYESEGEDIEELFAPYYEQPSNEQIDINMEGHVKDPEMEKLLHSIISSESEKQTGGFCHFVVDMIFQRFVSKSLTPKLYNMHTIPDKYYSDKELIIIRNEVIAYTIQEEKSEPGTIDKLNSACQKEYIKKEKNRNEIDTNDNWSALWKKTKNKDNTGPRRTLISVFFTDANDIHKSASHAIGLLRCPPKVEKGALWFIDPNQPVIKEITDIKDLMKNIKEAGGLLFKSGVAIIERICYRKYPVREMVRKK